MSQIQREVYKPITQTKPGQIGPEPGTAEWELNRGREIREERAAERALEESGA